MRITAISDTHTYHEHIKIEPTDMLICAGDYTFRGEANEIVSFLNWFSKQPATHKILINGNHEVGAEENPGLFKMLLSSHSDIIYLDEQMVEIEGLKIYGYPITPEFCGWSFSRDRGSPNMLKGLSLIPEGIDLLISHGPPHGILDLVESGEHVGCEDLLNELERIKPKVVVCGHLHSNNGHVKIGETDYYNVSILDDRYKIKYSPTIFDLDIKNKTE